MLSIDQWKEIETVNNIKLLFLIICVGGGGAGTVVQLKL